MSASERPRKPRTRKRAKSPVNTDAAIVAEARIALAELARVNDAIKRAPQHIKMQLLKLRKPIAARINRLPKWALEETMGLTLATDFAKGRVDEVVEGAAFPFYGSRPSFRFAAQQTASLPTVQTNAERLLAWATRRQSPERETIEAFANDTIGMYSPHRDTRPTRPRREEAR